MTLAQVFSNKFCKIYKNNFFTEHLWATASRLWKLFNTAACLLVFEYHQEHWFSKVIIAFRFLTYDLKFPY